MKNIGERIKEQREEKSLTQKELGRIVGVSAQVISNWERGYTPGIDHDDIVKLAKALSTSIEYLLGESKNPGKQIIYKENDTEHNWSAEAHNNMTSSKYKTNRKLKSALQAINDFLTGERGTTSYDIPYLLNILSLITGTGPIYPKIELADILDNKDLSITEGGKDLTYEKRQRLIEAIKNNDLIKSQTLPLLGNIRAGIPLLSEQNIIGHIDIPADMVGKADFALNVQGDSMIGAGINTGDIAVCKEDHEAVTGQIVVALVNGDETTLKYYFRENSRVLLRAANPDYKDIEFEPGDIIQGHVVKILKDPPPVNTYREYIYFKEGHLQEWNKVIEKAVASGIKPSLIGEFLESQMEIAKRLAGK